MEQQTPAKIDSAMSAAPASVADQATILDNAVDAVIDGECGTIPTTVIDFSQGEPEIVREGAGDVSRFE